jgi:hypothetical protein
MQIEIKGWVFAKPAWDAESVVYEFSQYDYEEWANNPAIDTDGSYKAYRKLGAHTISIEFDAPDLDPRQMLVTGLEAQKKAVRAELGRRIAEIEEQISKLLALPYVAAPDEEESRPNRDVSDVTDVTDLPF